MYGDGMEITEWLGTYTRRVWDEYWRKQEKRVWKAAFGLWRERNRTPEQTESPSARSAAEERAVHNRNQSVGLGSAASVCQSDWDISGWTEE